MTAISLYELKGEWLTLARKLSDLDLDPQTIADTIEASDVQTALEEKVQGYELVARTLEAPRSAIQAEIKRLQALDKTIAARSEALRSRVHRTLNELGITKVSCPLFEIRRQKNPAALDVFEEGLVPERFWHVPSDKVLDKAALKDALKAGEDIPGARLTQSEILRIK